MTKKRRPQEADVYVGARARVAREARKMSQEALARELGISFQQVQKYEKGTNRITAGRLHQMAGIMGVPITFFFDGLESGGKIDPGVPRARRFLATRQGALIADAFPRLSKRTQRTVVDLIRGGIRR